MCFIKSIVFFENVCDKIRVVRIVQNLMIGYHYE